MLTLGSAIIELGSINVKSISDDESAAGQVPSNNSNASDEGSHIVVASPNSVVIEIDSINIKLIPNSEIVTDTSDEGSSNDSRDNATESTSDSQSAHNTFASDLLDIHLAINDDHISPLVIYTKQNSVDYTSISDFEFQGTYSNWIWGTHFRVICYTHIEEKRLYCFYRSFKSEQSRLLNYAVLCIANIGLIAFLIQVFQTRDWLSLTIITTQLLFLTGCIIKMCVIRLSFALILDRFLKSLKPRRYITNIIMVRADSLCLEIAINAVDEDNDLDIDTTFTSIAAWSIVVVLQGLTMSYFILCMFKVNLVDV